ncbi:MAG: hypothetical protein AABX19_01940 [Nanoarchaeota archaeon]
MEKLIKITPNTERAKHILKIAEMTIERLKLTDTKEYVTLTTKDYYDVIKELMTAIALLDGYKTEGEGAHKILIEYIGIKYKEIATHEIKTVEDMREKRNKTYYEGILLPEDYLEKRRENINSTINKLKQILKNKIETNTKK